MAALVPEVPGYSELTEIGRGGFARVYRARQDRFRRDVALKVLDLADPDERTRERFERECQAMGELSWHPHVVAVYDSGTTDEGRLWLAMEFLERGSLAGGLSPRAALSWAAAVTTAIEVAGALGAAHAAGTLHRDLKPENVLIGPFGEAKLGDFGIAAVEGAKRTTTGVASFTVAHVAPEVLRGQRPDERTDVYGLASTVHTLLTGVPPFGAEQDEPVAAVMMRVIEAPPPRLGDPVPAPLAELLMTALAKDPADRPQSAAAFGQALQAVQGATGMAITPLRLTPDRPAPALSTQGAPTIGDAEAAGSKEAEASVPAPAPLADSRETVRVAATPESPSEGADGPDEELVPEERGRRSRRSQLLAVIGLVAPVVLVVGAISLLGGGDDDVAGLSTIPVGIGAGAIAVDGDTVWLDQFGGNTVARVDGATDTVVTSIDLDPSDASAAGLTVDGDGTVWVPDSRNGTVIEIDPSSDAVTNVVEIGDHVSAASAEGQDVWVTKGAAAEPGRVARLDAPTRGVTAVVDVGLGSNDVSATDDVVWITNINGNSVSRVDPDTNAVTATIALDSEPFHVSAVEDAVWLTFIDLGLVARIDPDTNQVVATVDLTSGADEIGDVAATPDAVWVTEQSQGLLVEIDPTTNEVVNEIDVDGRPGAVAATDEDVFVSINSDETLAHLDLATFRS